MDDGRRHHRRRHGWRGFILALTVTILMPFGIVARALRGIWGGPGPTIPPPGRRGSPTAP